jgi:hypothetical protein
VDVEEAEAGVVMVDEGVVADGDGGNEARTVYTVELIWKYDISKILLRMLLFDFISCYLQHVCIIDFFFSRSALSEILKLLKNVTLEHFKRLK